MSFFKNKTNILLTGLLSLVIGVAVFFVLMFINSKDKIIVPDFIDKNVSEVKNWCNSLENNPCSFTTDYSDSVAKDSIIYQSLNAEDELSGKISFIVSLGKKVIVQLPTIDSNTNKEVIETWAKDNSISNIKYIDEYSDDIEEGIVIKILPDKDITFESEVIVYISKGKNDGSNTSVIHVDVDAYTKLTQEQFESKVKALGLTPSYVSKKDDYSSSIDKGLVLWHGSGDYIKEEEIHYSLSLGKKDGNTSIEIKAKEYVGKTEDELKEIVSKLGTKGLTPNHGHNTYKDEYSDTYEKGIVIWHGSGIYEDGEQFNYVLSLGKKKSDGPIEIKADQYLGKTEAEVKKIIEELGLIANHGHSVHTDEYSDKYAKGTVIWHGSGIYEDGEKFNYVLSLGKKNSSDTSVYIEANSYVGKSESEVKEAVTKLGLTPNHGHSTYTDEYSDKYAKGTVIWHGSGTYVKDEKFNYVLSLGSAPKVSVINKAGSSESDFKTYISSLGMKLGTKTSEYSDTVASGIVISNDTGSFVAGASINYKVSLGKDTRVNVTNYAGKDSSVLESFISSNGLVADKSTQYSDSISEGKVISNTTGLLNSGSTISYVVSLGKKPEQKYTIMTAGYYNSYIGSSFDTTKNNLVNGPFANFTNVTYTGSISDKTAGVILSVKVNGSEISAIGEYVASTPVEITISTGN